MVSFTLLIHEVAKYLFSGSAVNITDN